MAPARHETFDAAQSENGDPGTAGYGTRSSSKRKSIEDTPNGLSPSKKRLSGRKSKTSPEANEVKAPPPKKPRLSPTSPPETSKSTTPAGQSRSPTSTPLPSEIPAIAVDAASGPSEGELSPTPQNGGWVEPPVVDEPKLPSPTDIPYLPAPPASSTRGRGRGRGRGFRGGRWGKSKGVSERATPAVTAPNPAGVKKLGRGGRRGRARRLGDARIQALYRRRDEIKEQYNTVAQLQKAALIVLADKSLNLANSDPTYHEKLPEFDEVTAKLKEKEEEAFARHQKEFDVKAAYYERLKDIQRYYEAQKLNEYMDERGEVYVAGIKERAIYLYHQGLNGAEVDEFPYPEAGSNRIVETIELPPKIVHPVASGHWPIQLAKSDAPSTLGDTDLEQHPANYWNSLTSDQKESWKEQAESEEKRKRKLVADMEAGRVPQKKGGALNARFLATTQDEVDDDEEAEEAEDEVEGETRAATPVQEQPQPQTPRNGKGKEKAKANEKVKASVPSDSDEDLAPEHPIDQYGVSVPARKGQQNKIIVPPSVVFEEHEIGVRKHLIKAKEDHGTERITSYKVALSPNPENFYLDQVKSSGVNNAKQTEADFDKKLINRHKLHPKLGIALRQSCNPYLPTDTDSWDELYERNTKRWADLDPTEAMSKVVIQVNRDGSRTLFRTSRSEWMLKTDKRFEQVHEQTQMRKLLGEAGDLEERPTPPPVIQPEEETREPIDATLLSAVNDAEADRFAEEMRRKEAPRAFKSPYAESSTSAAARNFPSPAPGGDMRPSMPAPTPQRSLGYDPVRDNYRTDPAPESSYRTPYAQPPPPPSGYDQGGSLAALSDAADIHKGVMPPPPPIPNPYRAQMSPYGPPPNPPPIMQSQIPYGQGFELRMFNPNPPAQGFPQQRGPPGGSLRAIRPAPPIQPRQYQQGRGWYQYGGPQ